MDYLWNTGTIGGAPGPIAPIESGETWASRSLTWTLDDYDTYGFIENRSNSFGLMTPVAD